MQIDRMESFEQIIVRSDRALGLKACFAIHDTTLGPAMGGVRRWPYPDEASGLRDARRLAAGLTL